MGGSSTQQKWNAKPPQCSDADESKGANSDFASGQADGDGKGLGLGMNLSWMMTKVCTSLPPLHSPQVIILEEEIEKTRDVRCKQKSSHPSSLQSVGPFHTSASWDQLDGSTGPSKGRKVAYHKNIQQVTEISFSLATKALICPLDYS